NPQHAFRYSGGHLPDTGALFCHGHANTFPGGQCPFGPVAQRDVSGRRGELLHRFDRAENPPPYGVIMFLRILPPLLKELEMLVQDRQSRTILIVPVFLQLALFPFAATLEVKNNTLAVFNEDSGRESTELMQRFSQAQAFTRMLALHSEADVRRTID